MPTGIPKKVTPAEIARYGHVAAFLREQMAARGWKKIADLNRALGLDPHNMVTFKWINARGGMGPASRRRLAKFFKVSPDFFLSRSSDAPPQLPAPGQSLVTTIPKRPTRLLRFEAIGDGQVRIQLDVTLPHEHGVPVFRSLLDAGLVLGEGGDAA